MTSKAEPGSAQQLDPGWGRFGAAVAVLILVAIGLYVLQAALVSNRTSNVAFTDAVERVQVEVGDGNVVIGNDPARVVRVVRKDSFVFRSPNVTQEMRDGVLVLSTNCDGFRLGPCRTNLDLTVSPDVPLDITSGNGRVRAETIRNSAKVKVSNGSIVMNETYDDLELITENGSIDATDVRSQSVQATSRNGDLDIAFTTAPASVKASTDNGDVVLALPEQDQYRLDASTGNGRTVIDVPVDASSNRVVDVRSENGDVFINKK